MSAPIPGRWRVQRHGGAVTLWDGKILRCRIPLADAFGVRDQMTAALTQPHHKPEEETR